MVPFAFYFDDHLARSFVYRFSRSLRSPQVPEFAFYSQSGMEEVSAPCYQLSSSAALIGNYVPFSEALS